jgi:two-component system, OmpR family, sensor histidine kinase NblS
MIISVISVFFLAVGCGIYINYQKTLEDNASRIAGMVTNMVAVGGSERLSGHLPEISIQSFADTMVRANADIVAIEFYDRQGNAIHKSQKPVSAQQLLHVTDYSVPLREISLETPNGKLLGTAHVKFVNKTLRDIRGATSWIIFWVFMTAWVISVVAVSLNTYILNKHLRMLVKGVKRLSDGDFGYIIPEEVLWGDLKLLARSFNNMSSRLSTFEAQNLETITFERNKLKTILLSIADGVVVCDLNAEIAIINTAACEMLGYKSSSWAIGCSLKDYTTVEGVKCFQSVIEAFEQERNTKTSDDIAQLLTHRLKIPERTIKLMLSPIQDDNDDMLGFVLILHDVTKEAEVDKMKTSFISNVSHELRTPVTTIKSYVDTLYNHGKELDQQTYDEFIETINIETDRLKKLVNDILDFSRLDEGTVLLERELQDISPIINLTVQSVKVLAEQKNITLSTAVESSLPKLYINSDSIERVIRNLLSNAIKYTSENGRIKVRAELIDDANTLEVSVTDNGTGIPEEHLANIFERFYRVENKVHTVKGTGLGLHLVKVAIEKHHQGHVFVTSKPDEGSTFGFRIPLGEPLPQVPSPSAGITVL